MRRENQVRYLVSRPGVDIPPGVGQTAFKRLRNRRFFHIPSTIREKPGEEICHRAFVIGGGFDLDQLTGKPDGIKRLEVGHDAARIPYGPHHRAPCRVLLRDPIQSQRSGTLNALLQDEYKMDARRNLRVKWYVE